MPPQKTCGDSGLRHAGSVAVAGKPTHRTVRLVARTHAAQETAPASLTAAEDEGNAAKVSGESKRELGSGLRPLNKPRRDLFSVA